MKIAMTAMIYEKGYSARGSTELRIKDHKLYLKSDRSSCTKFTANQFRLFLHSMAYILIHTLQKQVLKGSEYAQSRILSQKADAFMKVPEQNPGKNQK
jgi:hypothetical protein